MRLPLVIHVAALMAALSVATPVRAAWNPDPFNGGAVIVNTGGSQTYPASAPDGAGGAFIAWVEQFSSISIQHIDADGVGQWGAGGVVLGDTDGTGMVVVADGAGGVVVATSSGTGTNGHALRAYRLDASGTLLWIAVISASTQAKEHIRAIPDGTGGAIVTWWDSRLVPPGVSTAPVARASRVNGSGVVQWGASGVQLSTASTETDDPEICSDGSGGAIISWSDTRSSTERIYAQRYDATGAPQWTANGVQVCTAAASQFSSVIVSDGAGGAIVGWIDYRGFNYDLYAQRLSGAGARQWNTFGVAICTQGSHQTGPSICSDGANGAILSWDDPRSGNVDIYAQRVTGAGTTNWNANGVALCTAAGNQYPSRVVSDGAGGAIVTWEDFRDGLSIDIYARRIGANGVPQWATNGIAITRAAETQASMALVEAGGGAAIVAWHDYRTGTNNDIYAQRIDGLGYAGDPAPRITSVRDVPNDEGGYVKVSWKASYLDRDPELAIQHYIVERYVGPGWLLVADHVFGPQAEYSAVVQSAGDSIGPGNAPYSVYRVKAVAWNQPLTTFWYSRSDSARSIDNLGPLSPAPLTGTVAGGVTRLEWRAGREADLAGYRVYRGSSEDFEPSASNRIAETRNTAFEDPTGQPFVYRVMAVDAHGNESAPATWVPEGFDPAARPTSLALTFDTPSPNPTRRTAAIHFTLPSRIPVQVAVHDLNGRIVRMLTAGPLDAGDHRLQWDLRDGGGRRVAPGLYFARLSAAGEVRVRRMTVLD